MLDDVKKKPVKVIENDEENTLICKKLNEFLDEYYWLSNSSNPIEEVHKTMREKIQSLDNVERGSEEEKEILSNINSLRVKDSLLNNGLYESLIMEYIRAYTLMTEEYALRKGFSSPKEYSRKILHGDKNARKLFDYSLLRETGRVTMPEGIDLIPRTEVLSEFVKSYETSFVDIDLDEIKAQVSQDKRSCSV